MNPASSHDAAHGLARAHGVDRQRFPDPVLHLVFVEPEIPPNTGNAIRMCAGVGAHLHLCEPLGFTLEERQLRRAGLDYHDLVDVTVHPSVWECLDSLAGHRFFVFTTRAAQHFAEVEYQRGDVLIFGRESRGVDAEVVADERVQPVRIPMVEGRRSMNLSNAAAVAAYEAWRQLGYPDGV